jgi:hypothetical protein
MQHRLTTSALAMGAIAVACFAAGGLLRNRKRDGVARSRLPRVFISYRRQDSSASCGRIYDRLIAELGVTNVFRDIDSLAPGDVFAQKIRDCINQCDIFIVLIGKQWLSAVNEEGRRRLDDPADFVRMELLEAAIQGKPVFPTLVEGAQMPSPGGLPPELAFVSHRNAIEITDSHFASDMKRLIDAVAIASNGIDKDGRRKSYPSSGEDKLRQLGAAAIRQLPLMLFALGLLSTGGALWVAFG